MSFKQVQALAAKFAQKLATDPSEIKYILQRARLSGTPSLVSPLLERAQVPPHTTADVKLTVAPGPTATFTANLSPDHPQAAQTLTQLLNGRFGRLVNEALSSAKLDVHSPISLDWLNITRVGQ